MDVISSVNKPAKTLILGFEIIFILIVFFVLVNRIKYGVEFSDESWYVAEPYAVAEMGSVPFVNNISQSPGFTIPLAFAFKIFCLINGGTEGIVFFSRCLFLAVSFFTALITVFILNKYTSLKIPTITIIPLAVATNTGYNLYAINYHTIGLIYLPLILAFVYAEYNDNSKKSFIWGGLAGIFAARAIIGTVHIISALFIIFLTLCFQKKTKKIAGILSGCLLVGLIIICSVCLKYGFIRLLFWLKMYLNQGYFLMGNLWNFSNSARAITQMFKYAIIMFVAMGIVRIILKKPIAFDFLLKSVVIILLAIGIVYSIKRNDYLGTRISYLSWFLPFLYGFYSVRQSTCNKYIMLISFSYLCIFLFVSFTTATGFDRGKAYWLSVPAIITVVMLFNESREEPFSMNYISGILKNIVNVGVICILLFFAFFKIWVIFDYIYRDDDISKLTYKVDEGIWKGLYTSEKKAACIVDTEKYLKSITKTDDYILCLDWVSFGYMMVNGKICSPTTLDACHYTYNVNTPNPYYMYFASSNRVPDKIIYIDYGRDKIVSIDNPKWKFNEFVNSFYQEQHRYSNELFKIREYTVLNYESALKTAKAKADFN